MIPISIAVEDEELIPVYATDLAAGADVRAALGESCVILPGASRLIPTGIKVEIPPGYEIQIRPRSGLALKHGITVLNTPGTIDADYRGEIGVILINHGREPFTVAPKMRIAQLVLAPVARAVFMRVEEVGALTTRGAGGFGHTGTQ